MKIFKITTILLVITLVFSSCLSNKYSNKRKHENLEMIIHNDSEGFNFDNFETQADPSQKSRGLVIGDVVSVAVDGVKFLIELDKKKYTANYNSGKNQMYFYNKMSDKGAFDVTGMQFDGFSILRMISDKKGNNSDTALYISLKVDKENPYEIFNNSSFKLVVDDFKMNYGKAKISGYRWYLPWTIIYKKKNKINLDMEVAIMASWTGVNSSINRGVEIGKFHLNLRNIPLTDENKIKEEYRKKIIGKKISGYSFIVPRSSGFYYSKDNELKQVFGQGKYNILVSVKESGREHFITKIVQDNTDRLLDEVNTSTIRMFSKK